MGAWLTHHLDSPLVSAITRLTISTQSQSGTVHRSGGQGIRKIILCPLKILRLDRFKEVLSSLIIGCWNKQSRQKNRFFYLPSRNLLVRGDFFLTSNGFRDGLQPGEDGDCCSCLAVPRPALCEHHALGGVWRLNLYS